MTRFSSAKIGSVCRLVNGRAFKPSDWSDTGLPIIRIQNLNDSDKSFNYYNGAVDDRHRVDTGDVLLSWSGTPGTSFGCFIWDRGPGVLNQHIFKVHVDTDRVDVEFFVHAVNSKLDEMIAQAHGGVGLRHITKGKLEELQVPVLPDIEAQRQIANRVKDCLARVREVEALNNDVVRESTALSSSIIASRVVNDWPTIELGNVSTEICNGWSGKEVSDGTAVNVLKLSAVHGLVLDHSIVKPATVSERTCSQFAVVKDDVYMVRGNGSRHLVGRTAIAERSDSQVIFNDLLIRIRFAERMLPQFANLVFHSVYVRKQIENAAKTAAGIWKINQGGIRQLQLPCPDKPAQVAFVEEVSCMRRHATEIVKIADSDGINYLKRAILRSIFSGDV